MASLVCRPTFRAKVFGVPLSVFRLERQGPHTEDIFPFYYNCFLDTYKPISLLFGTSHKRRPRSFALSLDPFTVP